MRRRTLFEDGGLQGTVVEAANTVAGNLMLYDRTNDTKVFINIDAPTQTFSLSRYVPIGVVVVPPSHFRYSKSSRIGAAVSLVNMSHDTPEVGTTEIDSVFLTYGPEVKRTGYEITDMRIKYIPSIGIPSNQQTTITWENNLSSFNVPSDFYSGPVSSQDAKSRYESASSPLKAIPSPYVTNGSANPLYASAHPNSAYFNIFSDFSGAAHTNKAISLRGSVSAGWKPTTVDDYPAFSCCNLFHTEGTSQGQWYLPACGELGYMINRGSTINKTIQYVINACGADKGVLLTLTVHDEYPHYWTSNDIGYNEAVYWFTDFATEIKDNGFKARAFILINT